ncbi:MAG: ATP-binding protein [Proteobacteria bacterium]|nr:ATP-binding protein [Pseudomonadota bacterium]
MKNIVGTPVHSSNFFGRKSEAEFIFRCLSNKQSVFLYGPRRIGKTSFIRQLMFMYSEDLFFIYLDLEGANTNNHLGLIINAATNDYSSVTSSHEQVGIDDFLYSLNSIRPNNKRAIIILDEFSLFLERYSIKGEIDVKDLLQQHKVLRSTPDFNISFLYSSEVNPMRYHFLGNYMNDVLLFELPPLSKNDSFELIKALSIELNIRLHSNTFDKIYDFSNGSPFNIQLLFRHLFDHNFDKVIDNNDINGILVDELYQMKQYRYHLPPQNDSFESEAEIESIVDKTNK